MIRLEMTKKQEAVLAAIILVAAIVVFVLYTGIGRPSESEPVSEPGPPPPTLSEVIAEYIEDYDKVDKELLEKLGDESEVYSISNPLVVADPYGTSPLTALILFQTEEPAKVTVTIIGKTPDVSINRVLPGFNTNHIIPVYGLYPDTVNLIEITAESEDASLLPSSSSIIMIETDGISSDFHDNLLGRTPDNPDITGNPFFYFTCSPGGAFDVNGDYRWTYEGIKSDYPIIYSDDGNMFIIAGSVDKDALLLEINMLGRIISAEPIGEGFEIPVCGEQSVHMRKLYP